MVKWDEYLEFLYDYVTETGAHTFTTKSVATPVGRSSNLAMVIHGVVWERSGTFVHGAENDSVLMGLSSISPSSSSGLFVSNPNVVFMARDHTYYASVAGFAIENRVKNFWFPTPVLYAKNAIHAFVEGSANQSAAQTFYFKLAYTIRKVGIYKMLESLVD